MDCGSFSVFTAPYTFVLFTYLLRAVCSLKDTLQTETSDVRLDEVQVFVSVVVLLLQRADGVTL